MQPSPLLKGVLGLLLVHRPVANLVSQLQQTKLKEFYIEFDFHTMLSVFTYVKKLRSWVKVTSLLMPNIIS